MPPSIIKNVATPLFTTFSTRMARMFEGVVSASPRSRSPSRPPMPRDPPSTFELGGAVSTIEGTKEERRYAASSGLISYVFDCIARFLALNPRGTLDYALPSEGNLSGYLGEKRISRIFPVFTPTPGLFE